MLKLKTKLFASTLFKIGDVRVDLGYMKVELHNNFFDCWVLCDNGCGSNLVEV